jgi:hypothetical protein
VVHAAVSTGDNTAAKTDNINIPLPLAVVVDNGHSGASRAVEEAGDGSCCA